MAKYYKMWVQIEEVDDEEDHYENVTEPDVLYETDDFDQAQDVLEKLIHVVDALAERDRVGPIVITIPQEEEEEK